jgi:hypothetical protein
MAVVENSPSFQTSFLPNFLPSFLPSFLPTSNTNTTKMTVRRHLAFLKHHQDGDDDDSNDGLVVGCLDHGESNRIVTLRQDTCVPYPPRLCRRVLTGSACTYVLMVLEALITLLCRRVWPSKPEVEMLSPLYTGRTTWKGWPSNTRSTKNRKAGNDDGDDGGGHSLSSSSSIHGRSRPLND